MRLYKRGLGEAYQRDTGRSAIVDGMEVSARIGSWGDVIIGSGELPEEMVNDIVFRGTFDVPDMDYVEWLEERLVGMGFKWK